MSQKSQRLKDLLIIFNLSDSSLSSAVGDNREKPLHFLRRSVAVGGAGWWSLLNSRPQPETAPAPDSDFCTCSGTGGIYKVTLFSPKAWVHTSDPPAASPEARLLPQQNLKGMSQNSWRLRQGWHWFHTLWLCHALASDTRIINPMFSVISSAIKKGSRRLKKNEVPYGTKRQAGCGSPCTHPPRHPIPLVLRGDPALCTWEYFGGIKSQICTQSTLMGLTRWVVHVLPVEVLIAYWEVLTPQQGNTATPLLYAHQGR